MGAPTVSVRAAAAATAAVGVAVAAIAAATAASSADTALMTTSVRLHQLVSSPGGVMTLADGRQMAASVYSVGGCEARPLSSGTSKDGTPDGDDTVLRQTTGRPCVLVNTTSTAVPTWRGFQALRVRTNGFSFTPTFTLDGVDGSLDLRRLDWRDAVAVIGRKGDVLVRPSFELGTDVGARETVLAAEAGEVAGWGKYGELLLTAVAYTSWRPVTRLLHTSAADTSARVTFPAPIDDLLIVYGLTHAMPVVSGVFATDVSVSPLNISAGCSCAKRPPSTRQSLLPVGPSTCAQRQVTVEPFVCDLLGGRWCATVSSTRYKPTTPLDAQGTCGCVAQHTTVHRDVEPYAPAAAFAPNPTGNLLEARAHGAAEAVVSGNAGVSVSAGGVVATASPLAVVGAPSSQAVVASREPIVVTTTSPVAVSTPPPVVVASPEAVPSAATTLAVDVDTTSPVVVQTASPVVVTTPVPTTLAVPTPPAVVVAPPTVSPVAVSTPDVAVSTQSPVAVETRSPVSVETRSPVAVNTTAPAAVDTTTPVAITTPPPPTLPPAASLAPSPTVAPPVADATPTVPTAAPATPPPIVAVNTTTPVVVATQSPVAVTTPPPPTVAAVPSAAPTPAAAAWTPVAVSTPAATVVTTAAPVEVAASLPTAAASTSAASVGASGLPAVQPTVAASAAGRGGGGAAVSAVETEVAPAWAVAL